MNDLSKEKVSELNHRMTLYHVVNRAGEEYSTVEDGYGIEIYSCRRDREAEMLKYFCLEERKAQA